MVLFGWTAHERDMGGIIYTVFMNADRPAGGMLKIDKNCGEEPPNLLVYFAVNDCDAYVGLAQSIGGEAFSAPMDIPGVGRMTAMKDSQGAVFAVI